MDLRVDGAPSEVDASMMELLVQRREARIRQYAVPIDDPSSAHQAHSPS